jgi:fumarate hydratase class I
LIVARDIAHAKIKELLDAGKPMPEYFKTIQFIMLQNARRNAFRKFWTNYRWSYGCYVEEFQNRVEA